MKKYNSYIFLACLSLSCYLPAMAQEASPLQPPGTIKFQNNLYIDKTEIANVHWLEFLYHIRRDSGMAYYEKMLPDTLIWAERNLPNPQVSSPHLTKKYFGTPEYLYFPVVGISYEQAQDFARWRSAVVNLQLNQPEELQKLGLEGKRIIVEYRLPTEEEWMTAAAAGLPSEKYPYGYQNWLQKPPKTLDPEQAFAQIADPKPSYKNFKRNFKKAWMPYFRVVVELPWGISLAPEHPGSALEGTANGLGLLHIIGNVAEMTSGPGIAKGGSFMHLLEDSEILDRQQYYGPAPWLGVRYVAEVRVE